jgi:hypothetical protein
MMPTGHGGTHPLSMICDFFDLFSFSGGGGPGGAAFLLGSGSNARKFSTSVFFASAAAFATSKMFDMAIELVCCRNNTESS